MLSGCRSDGSSDNFSLLCTVEAAESPSSGCERQLVKELGLTLPPDADEFAGRLGSHPVVAGPIQSSTRGGGRMMKENSDGHEA